DLACVVFSALWRRTTGGTTASAALFIGGVQLQTFNDAGAPTAQEVSTTNSDNDWLRSTGTGLAATTAATAATDVTTGMLTASGLLIVDRLAPGTYDFEVKYKCAASGPVLASKRRLYVFTREFPTSGI